MFDEDNSENDEDDGENGEEDSGSMMRMRVSMVRMIVGVSMVLVRIRMYIKVRVRTVRKIVYWRDFMPIPTGSAIHMYLP